MTVKEEISKFKHEVEEVLHDVEEVLYDVKENMLLSVRDYSIQIAFVLMGITSAILVIGTVYVWCFHHPKRPRSKDADNQEHPSSEQSNVHQELPSSEQSDIPNHQHSENSDSLKSQKTEEENKADDTHQEVFETVEKTEESDTVKSEQNGQVRKRTTSSSVNNNNSPVKSKIPVRQKSRTS